MRQADPSITLSVRLVEWLKGQGKTQKNVADLLGVSESFMSRVASGGRSLTFEHLALLEERLGLPLAVLLLEADLAKETTPKNKAIISEAISLLRASYDLRSELASDEKHVANATSSKGGSRVKRRKAAKRKTIGAA